jgi:hypothetical protein
MADADHFLLDMSSIAGNPAKWPFCHGLKLLNRIRSADAKLQSV